jgi:undecaprenyl-diphosphatase
MNAWQAIVLGVVEGVTEFLPVSSTGHLLLAQRILGIAESTAANAFAICIQGGAIIAVIGIFRRRVWQMWLGAVGVLGLGPLEPRGAGLLKNLTVAFLPAMILGALFDDIIERNLMGLWPVVAAWFVGGVAILAVDFWTERSRGGSASVSRDLDDLTWPMALAIGLAQVIAMCPGTSRSLATILAGLLLGMSLGAAVEFSFLLGVLTLLAATCFKAVKGGAAMLEAYTLETLALGGVAAALSAFVAVRWMLSFLRHRRMAVFGYYRMALAIAVGFCLYAGWVSE